MRRVTLPMWTVRSGPRSVYNLQSTGSSKMQKLPKVRQGLMAFLVMPFLEAKASLWSTPVRPLVSQSASQLVTLSWLSHRGAFASPQSWMGLLL